MSENAQTPLGIPSQNDFERTMIRLEQDWHDLEGQILNVCSGA